MNEEKLVEIVGNLEKYLREEIIQAAFRIENAQKLETLKALGKVLLTDHSP